MNPQTIRQRRCWAAEVLGWPGIWRPPALLVALLAANFSAPARSTPAEQFRKTVEPILANYCYDCHGSGMKKGGVTLDEFASEQALLDSRDLWWNVLSCVRAGIMPPPKRPRPSADERQSLESWIKYDVLGIDRANLDPGRVTIRRLNRVEYHNTIRDLMGVDFKAQTEFPPDDSGYGFDNIGDVLTVSPMLLEKYVAAAKFIVGQAGLTVPKVMAEKTISGARFRASGAGDQPRGRIRDGSLALSFYAPASVSSVIEAEHAGTYRLALDVAVRGGFFFDPGKCQLVFTVDGQELLHKEFGWHDNKTFHFELEPKWQPGEHALGFELRPLESAEHSTNSLDLIIEAVAVRGPIEQQFWVRSTNYARFFPREIPQGSSERRQYAHQILQDFTLRAFRRPADEATLTRLTALAESCYSQPGKAFQVGIAQAMVAVLSSPRFLFRLEQPAPGPAQTRYPLVDELSLASRLSYFLWSTMPDDELLSLARRGELRKSLASQVQRMLADPRSEAFIQNFAGQWLQTRDVEGISIDAKVVQRRDRQPHSTPDTQHTTPDSSLVELDRDLRRAMQRETELYFAGIVRGDRDVTELVNSDYSYLNERLARLYGVPDVRGPEFRRVTFPADSPRGGVLTHASVLVVTSNPDRTSPVKRGLFVLDNVLGTPAPPPPANVPALEATEKDFKDHDPTLREALEAHRATPACAACHARMDPIGLAFEHFNALGMWRDQERGQPIVTAGKLITGESFEDVAELKRILAQDHRQDFYRCLTGKLLTYALGRGLEPYDVESLDQIVARLERQNGRFSALLMGIIESAPFQKQRNATIVSSASSSSS